jgi:Ras-related protein Rab-28
MASDDDSSSSGPGVQQFKLVLVGDGAVGKTSLATRLASDTFGKQYKQTLGLDFFRREMTLPGDVTAALQVWDIGGQAIGSRMLANYVHGAHAIALAYDVTNYQSFANLEEWHGLVQAACEARGVAMPYLAVLANKTDLNHIR